MAIKTTRTQEVAQVQIDHSRCKACGLCATVCGMTLYMDGGRVCIDQNKLFGCMGCAQCVTVCPEGCVTVVGRTLSEDDVLQLPPVQERASYESMQALLVARRSVRKYLEREVEAEKIAKILEAAAAAPMGLPPSDVSVLVLGSREKVRQFSFDFIDYIAVKRWMFSAPMLFLLRPFIGKENIEMMTDFVKPFIDFAIEGKRHGQDYILYGAPLAMLFQASPYSDPADPHIAATYAMLAGEAMGLGTCMIGAVAPMIKYAPGLKAKYNIRPDMRSGLVVLFGYPAVRYIRGIRRTFANVDYV